MEVQSTYIYFERVLLNESILYNGRFVFAEWKKKKERALNEGNLDGLFFACKELAELYFREEKYDLALREYKVTFGLIFCGAIVHVVFF